MVLAWAAILVNPYINVSCLPNEYNGVELVASFSARRNMYNKKIIEEYNKMIAEEM